MGPHRGLGLHPASCILLEEGLAQPPPEGLRSGALWARVLPGERSAAMGNRCAVSRERFLTELSQNTGVNERFLGGEGVSAGKVVQDGRNNFFLPLMFL